MSLQDPMGELALGTTICWVAGLRNPLGWTLAAATAIGRESLWRLVLTGAGESRARLVMLNSSVGLLLYWVIAACVKLATRTSATTERAGPRVPQHLRRRAIRRILFNQICIQTPLAIVVAWGDSRWHILRLGSLPSPIQLARSLVIIKAVYELSFYYVHRWMHRPGQYRRFHSEHHMLKHPDCLTAQMMHPVEFVLTTLCFIVGALIVRAHAVTALLATILQSLTGQIAHDLIEHAWAVPLFPGRGADSGFHLLHHETGGGSNSSNFAESWHWIDRLHGTSSAAPAGAA